LQHISLETLRHYEGHAADFWAGTKGHDVTQNYQALLDALPKQKRLDILDFGCGPGRDLLYFKNLGHHAVGLEGSHRFCEMAQTYSGCEVLQQDFLDLKLPPESFDGIFANASLFHVPSQELPRVLRQLWAALRPGGVLFSSNPRGHEEGWDGKRYGTYMEFETYQNFLEAAGFVVEHHYYRPTEKPRDQQPWLAVVCRKGTRTTKKNGDPVGSPFNE
jgi:SAM-dependent methyltransferase